MAEIDISEVYAESPGQYPASVSSGIRTYTSAKVSGIEFDVEGYAKFLQDVRFSPAFLSRVLISFLPYSPVLEKNRSGWMDAEKVQTGSYGVQDGRHEVSLFIADAIRESIHTGLLSNEVLNESLGHETGHMYQIVMKKKYPSISRRLWRSLGHTGVRLSGITQGAAETLVHVSEALESRRYATCSHEAFANTFRTDFNMPDFIRGRAELTE